MIKIQYQKQLQSYSDQINNLKQHGLTFLDEIKADQWLRKVSFYRLSGYWHPLLVKPQTNIFKPGSTFEQVCQLYEFDYELKNFLLANISKAEIAVRTQLAYILSLAYGGFWIENATLFANQNQHQKTIQSINDEYNRSDELFVKTFKNKYSNPLPPSWITLEISSFGTISMIYQNLNPGLTKRTVASAFGVGDSVFSSWLHSLVYVRNICAHHARLWNRTLGVRPLMPRKPHHTFITWPSSGTQHVYFTLAIVKYWLDIIEPQNNFTLELNRLLMKYPTVNVNAMGFPAGWEREPFWQ